MAQVRGPPPGSAYAAVCLDRRAGADGPVGRASVGRASVSQESKNAIPLRTVP
ncbi:hypothetical protein [Streptomyces sp. bgisy100]|uniref:hypothetical protein n=1 Tax=Streptomyces sp. bgisy100 TaxID=3413783 RepID=UPI003D75CFE2